MSFRDDADALRAHVETVESELARARGELEAQREVAEEAVALRARVAELEAQLARLLETPEQKAARARAEQARAEAEEVARAAEAAPQRQRRVMVGVLSALMTIVGVAVFLVVNRAPAWRASDAPPLLGVLDTAHASLPARFEGTTHGSVSAPSSCPGYLSEAPQLVIETPSAASLLIEASSDTDTVLVLYDAEGQLRCDDDGAGDFNPRITTNVPAGRHRLWLGTYDSGDASFVLTVGGIGGAPATR